MTYQIQISPSKQIEFLQIIESLKRLGVIKKIKEFDISPPGKVLSEDELLKMIAESEKQDEEGLTYSTDEVTEFLELWQQRKK